ncbi:glutamate racemase [Alsobacter soli]|uniref:Glutamate racemase n=1 Tax=Alsobacter soli TaxID=2109933 RepID=A0A2T1HRR0_9HYPH|nr:glutamate racemase [Alsobacter soli]PSC04315.1 glutamate racemase [Alsobacter soli]
MRVDLWAGIQYHGVAMSPPRAPTILIFDSGLGGLTVFREVLKARPDARFVYAADDAGFPYGRLDEATLVARVVAVIERLLATHQPDLVVIACNTASTLVLPALRARFPIPFVGTVPAIKPAAERSRTRHIAVLATPGTVKRDYTQALIDEFAGTCRVTLVGSVALAALCEAVLKGEDVPDAALAAELAPCFPEGDPRTDVVVLGCTHYPLVRDRLERLAPWPVTWIDPAPAIARRVVQLIGAPLLAHESEDDATMVLTGGHGVTAALRQALEAFGLPRVEVEPMPLAGVA